VRELVADDQQQQRLESKIRDLAWERGDVSGAQRAELLGHPASMVMLTGEAGVGKHAVARHLELRLATGGKHAYLLDGKNVFLGVDADMHLDDRAELVRRFGEVAHILLDAGLIVISTTNVIGLADHTRIQTQIAPVPMFIVHVGPAEHGLPEGADLRLDPRADVDAAVDAIVAELSRRGRLALGNAG
jgi:bifunctional enzyme CysN/CysC